MDFYDRQTRILGIDSINIFNNSSILIIGLKKSLAKEICKNLILCGINKIYLYDDNKDNYIILKQELLLLNRNTIIEYTNTYEINTNVIVLINQSIEFIKEINNFTRINNIKLIVLFSGGLCGSIFVDVGLNYTYINNDINSTEIASISSSGLVKCSQYSTHNFNFNDKIIFLNLEGTNLDFLNKEWNIQIINNTSFQLLDFNYQDNFIFINGIAKNIENKKTINHNYFYTIKNKITDNFIKLYNNNLINNMPFIWDNNMTSFLIDNNLDEFSRILNIELPTTVSIICSFVSFEIIKLCINKYKPISQWFEWEDNELLPINKPEKYNNNSIFSMLYGTEYENKLINSDILIIGAGSVGCEHIKNLNLLKLNKISIIDYDIVKDVNLNTHLLYNKNDINNYKTDSIKNINNITKFNDKIENNLELLNNKLAIFTAVDNYETRHIIDEECFKLNIPLFDCGIDGLMGYTQPIIPYITETYSNSNNYNIKTYPACLINNFPNKIEHTIQWSIEQFDKFKKIIELLNNTHLINNENIELFDNYPINFNKTNYINYALHLFNNNYNIKINNLLDLYSDNEYYWSSGKRKPTPLIYNNNNKQHLEYIKYTINILLLINNINISITDEEIKKFNISDIYTYKYNINKIKNIINNKKINNIDSNLYNNWITISSNLRATNYNINNTDLYFVKGITENIIPNIIMTSSLVSGLIINEFLKYILKINSYKLSFFNIQFNNIIKCSIKEQPKLKFGNIELNGWEKFEYNTNSTVLEFKNFYENIFKMDIDMIVMDTQIIYADFMSENLNKMLYDILLFDSNIISLTLLTNNDIELPTIIIKK